MALDKPRLTGTMYTLTKSELFSYFGGFKTGLLPAEQAGFDDAIDKLAHAIAEGDAPVTIDEFDDNAQVSGIIQTPGVQLGSDTITDTFTLGID